MNHIVKDPQVRLWLYGIFIAAGALTVGYGLLTIEQSGLWLTLIGAILGLSNGLAAANVPPKPGKHSADHP